MTARRNIAFTLHFHLPHHAETLVHVPRGAALDVVVALRPESPTKPGRVRLSEVKTALGAGTVCRAYRNRRIEPRLPSSGGPQRARGRRKSLPFTAWSPLFWQDASMRDASLRLTSRNTCGGASLDLRDNGSRLQSDRPGRGQPAQGIHSRARSGA